MPTRESAKDWDQRNFLRGRSIKRVSPSWPQVVHLSQSISLVIPSIYAGWCSVQVHSPLPKISRALTNCETTDRGGHPAIISGDDGQGGVEGRTPAPIGAPRVREVFVMRAEGMLRTDLTPNTVACTKSKTTPLRRYNADARRPRADR